MKEHKCTIGLIKSFEDSFLTNLEDLKEHIEFENEQERYNNRVYETKLCLLCLKDFIDGVADFEKFDFCPFCGKAIDWKKIKEEADNGRN